MIGAAVGQETTTSPGTTPAGAGTATVKLSFVIDGVVYTATCVISSANLTNCTFDMDHGLNVTRLLATGESSTTDLPVYFQVIVYITLAIVVILAILAIVAYSRWRAMQAGYEPAPQSQGPAQGYPTQYSGPPVDEYGRPVYNGSASQLAGSHKVIQVGLIRPSCLPPGEVMVP